MLKQPKDLPLTKPTPPPPHRDAVLSMIDRYARAIEHWFARGSLAPRDAAWHRRLRLGIDTWLSLEEHVMLPAWRRGRAQPAEALQGATAQIEALRKIVLHHADAPMQIEGRVRRHVRATEAMLQAATVIPKIDWVRLHGDIRDCISPWLDGDAPATHDARAALSASAAAPSAPRIIPKARRSPVAQREQRFALLQSLPNSSAPAP